jgi:hypothetical protein
MELVSYPILIHAYTHKHRRKVCLKYTQKTSEANDLLVSIPASYSESPGLGSRLANRIP